MKMRDRENTTYEFSKTNRLSMLVHFH